jgi:cell division protein FtsI/penicillin-binding protein 2
VAPNQGSKQATIDYLAGLGITAKSDAVRLLQDRRPEPDDRQQERPAREQHAQRGPDRGRLSNRPGARLRRQRRVLREARAGSGQPGKNLFDPQFDVLSNGYRQPGSSFKPINYTVGIQDKTMTAASLFMDVATNMGGGYTPHDADNYERGPVRMREALQYSLNIPAVKAASINGVDHLHEDRAQDFGLSFPPNSNPGVSLGIGTVEVRPADLVSRRTAPSPTPALLSSAR